MHQLNTFRFYIQIIIHLLLDVRRFNWCTSAILLRLHRKHFHQQRSISHKNEPLPSANEIEMNEVEERPPKIEREKDDCEIGCAS